MRASALVLTVGIALAGSATAVATAHFGGELVYGQGVGSETLREYLKAKAAMNTAAAKMRSATLDAGARTSNTNQP